MKWIILYQLSFAGSCSITHVFLSTIEYSKLFDLQPGEFVKLRNVHAASHKFKESEIGGSFNRPMVDLCLHRGGTQYNRGIDVLCRNDSDVQRLPLIDILKNDEQLEIEKIRTHSDPISSDNTPGLEEGNVEDSFEQYFTPESAIQRKSIGIKRKFIDDSEAYGSGSERCMKTTATGKLKQMIGVLFGYLCRASSDILFSNGFSFFFSAKILRIWLTDSNQIFVKPPKPWSLEIVEPKFWIFVCEGQKGRKTPQKSENSDIGVQSFGHNSETNQDIKNRNSSLTSTINSEVNDI